MKYNGANWSGAPHFQVSGLGCLDSGTGVQGSAPGVGGRASLGRDAHLLLRTARAESGPYPRQRSTKGDRGRGGSGDQVQR